MTELREQMHRDYESAYVDLDALAGHAQRHGGRARRRRRLTMALGAFAALAVLGAGAYTVLPGGEQTVRDTTGFAAAPAEQAPLTVPEALAAAVTRVLPGSTVAEAQELESPEGFGENWSVQYTAADGSTELIQFSYGEKLPSSLAPASDCPGARKNCETFTLPDGSEVQMWDSAFGGDADAGRIVGAARSFDEAGLGIYPLTTSLTRDQLREIISQPEFANLVPVENTGGWDRLEQ
jgi:hypothetical protein